MGKGKGGKESPFFSFLFPGENVLGIKLGGGGAVVRQSGRRVGPIPVRAGARLCNFCPPAGMGSSPHRSRRRSDISLADNLSSSFPANQEDGDLSLVVNLSSHAHACHVIRRLNPLLDRTTSGIIHNLRMNEARTFVGLSNLEMAKRAARPDPSPVKPAENRAGPAEPAGLIFCPSSARSEPKRAARKNGSKSGLNGPVSTF
jgi:hypothetical protein